MITRLAILLIALQSISISLQAQSKKEPGFSKEAFRSKQEAYLTEKAGLTQEEAAKFFPIYFELQDRKKRMNDESWKLMRQGKSSNTTEAEYEKIIDHTIETRIETDKLDLEYLQKFKKILSAQKIYKIQHAEMKFHRELLKIMHHPQKEERKK